MKVCVFEYNDDGVVYDYLDLSITAYEYESIVDHLSGLIDLPRLGERVYRLGCMEIMEQIEAHEPCLGSLWNMFTHIYNFFKEVGDDNYISVGVFEE